MHSKIPLTLVEADEQLRALAAVPVSSQGQVIACLNIASKTEDEFRELQRTALETIATQIGSAIRRLQLETKLLSCFARRRRAGPVAPCSKADTQQKRNDMTKTQMIQGAILLAGVLLASGCGKPQAQNGGPPAGAPAMAVVAKVVQQRVEDKLELVASLKAKEEISVVSEIAAKVTEISFSEGEPIEAGQVFFRLDDVSTSARLKEAEAQFKLAELSYKRSQDLFKSQTVSQQELDQAEAEHHGSTASLALARDEMSKTAIKAPFKGVAGERLVSVGQYVRVGDELTRLYCVDPIELVFNIPERHAGRLARDQTVNFTTAAFPDESFSGQIVYISPSLAVSTRTVRVKAEIPNPQFKLKPGMFGRLALVFATKEDGLVIPESAIQFMGEATMVVKVNEAGLSEFVPVQIGQRFSKQVEVLSGLKAGELVVVEGHQKMGPGMRVVATADSAAYGVSPGPLFPQEEEPSHTAGAGTPDQVAAPRNPEAEGA